MAATILPTSTDYTDRDLLSLRARLQNLITTAFPEWSERSVANFGNILAELPAHTGDVIAYYLDKAARESRIGTAQLRRSLLGLCKLIGFTPPGAGAGIAIETFTLGAPVQVGATFTLLAGQKVKTAEVTAPVKFQLLEDLVFAVGESIKTAEVEHSEFAQDVFTSNGQQNQRFLLRRTPFLEGSATIVAANGTYEVVRNFLDSASGDRHAVITVDQRDQAAVRFGNGTNGAVPSGTITIDYKTGGGIAGKIEAGRLKAIDGSSFQDSLGSPVQVTVTNVEATSGASDRTTNAQIRLLAPESIRVLERAVAREDFEVVAKGVPGVARVLCLTRNEDLGVPENSGYIFVVPTGGGTASPTLLAAVKAKFTSGSGTGLFPTVNTFQLNVLTAAYLNVDVFAQVFKRPGFTGAQVKANITEALTDYFAISLEDGTPNPLIDFGFNLKRSDGTAAQELAWSDIFNEVRDTAGVRKIGDGPTGFLLNTLQRDVAVPNFALPQLGTLTIIDGDTGLTL